MRFDVKKIGVTTAALVLAANTAAFGLVFPAKSPGQKLRADIAKQVALYSKCLIRALLACEKTGVSVEAECSLESATATPPADPKGKFAAAIAKCDAAVDYGRKGIKNGAPFPNYELLGCPAGTIGQPPLADLDEFQAIVTKAKGEIDGIAEVIGEISGCTDTKSCVADAKVIATFAAAFGKCQTLCENDYKDKKGNGGIDDDTSRCDPNGDAAAVECIEKAQVKFLDKAATWPLGALVPGAVASTIDAQSDGLFNAPPNCL
jgi:hypothetical protein